MMTNYHVYEKGLPRSHQSTLSAILYVERTREVLGSREPVLNNKLPLVKKQPMFDIVEDVDVWK